jgi:hypothetical protein
MNRVLAGTLCLAVTVLFPACSAKETPTTPATNQSAQTAPTQSAPKPEAAQPAQQPAQPGELQPGQASGSFTAKGEVVELKYSYAGRAERFGTDSLVVLVTEKPLPPEAIAEEIKSTTLLEGEKIRGLEYVIDENSMWVRYHPGQYQESSSNKLKDYKVENNIVRAVDDNDGDLSNGKYARSVKFVATIVK